MENKPHNNVTQICDNAQTDLKNRVNANSNGNLASHRNTILSLFVFKVSIVSNLP